MLGNMGLPADIIDINVQEKIYNMLCLMFELLHGNTYDYTDTDIKGYAKKKTDVDVENAYDFGLKVHAHEISSHREVDLIFTIDYIENSLTDHGKHSNICTTLRKGK